MMNSTGKKSMLGIIGIIILICAGIIFYTTTWNTSKEDPEIVEFTGSLAYGYADLNELVKDSDLIAYVKTGKVVKVLDDQAIPITDVELTVTKPIHNTKKGEKIIVQFAGGTFKDEADRLTRWEIEGDLVPKKGEEFLVFAKQGEPGVYGIVGGPQGRYVLQDGIVSSMGGYENIISRKGISSDKIDKELIEIIKATE